MVDYRSKSFIIYRGDYKTLRFTVRDSAELPVDLTSYPFVRFSLKVPNATTFALKKATANITGGGDDQVKITDIANGVIEVYIKEDDLTSVTTGLYEFDVTLQDAVGKTYTIIQGSVVIEEQITNWTDIT